MLTGCQSGGSSHTPVARIDNETLTLEALRAQFDSSKGVSEAQAQEYIRRWINNEILYREAIRRGLDKNETVVSRFEEARRQLVINALLEEEIYNEKSLESAPEEIGGYYQQHLHEFAVPADVAQVSFVLFSNRDAANAFRTAVLRGTPWSDALKQMRSDLEQAASIVAGVDSAYHTQATLVPAELWRVAAASMRAEPSFPIRTNDGFYILSVWKFMRKGQTADIQYVEQEIRGRLAIERRQRMLDSLMENLRAKHTVQILFKSGDGDTATKPKE